ncbi:MAG: hypothetical protein ACM3X4_06355 [Ignavibacteriales bacterium]
MTTVAVNPDTVIAGSILFFLGLASGCRACRTVLRKTRWIVDEPAKNRDSG